MKTMLDRGEMKNEETIAVGMFENIEAEFGITELHGFDFVLVLFFKGEPVSVEGYLTEAQARAAVKQYHGVSHVDYLF